MIDIFNSLFLFFAIILVSIAIYSGLIIVFSIYIHISAKEMATFSLIMFLFGFSVSSYLDMNGVDLFVSGLLLFILTMFFSYRLIKKKRLEKRLVENT